MAPRFADIKKEYAKDKDLKEEDAKVVLEWVNSQPHLPKINEIQAVAFLKKSHYRVSSAKSTIDSYFTLKELWPDLLSEKSLKEGSLKGITDVLLATFLPETTPEGYKIIFMRILGPDMVNYEVSAVFKFLDIFLFSDLYQNGTSNGYLILFDAIDYPYEYIAKLDFHTFKRYFYFMQETLPVDIKGIHYINAPQFFVEGMSIAEGAAPKELLSHIHLHEALEDLDKFIPRDILPSEYGGLKESAAELHEKSKSELLKLDELFEWENQQMVVESRRPSDKTGVFDF